MARWSRDAQLQRVLGYLDDGRQAGVSVVTGGGRFDDPELAGGYFVRPTILSDVTPDMRVAREEIFGPVISTLRFDDEDEAVAVANGTEYGLAAGVYTQDVDRALRVAQALEAGQVYVNGYQAVGVETAFGGVKKPKRLGAGEGPGGGTRLYPVQDHDLHLRMRPVGHRAAGLSGVDPDASGDHL